MRGGFGSDRLPSDDLEYNFRKRFLAGAFERLASPVAPGRAWPSWAAPSAAANCRGRKPLPREPHRLADGDLHAVAAAGHAAAVGQAKQKLQFAVARIAREEPRGAVPASACRGRFPVSGSDSAGARAASSSSGMISLTMRFASSLPDAYRRRRGRPPPRRPGSAVRNARTAPGQTMQRIKPSVSSRSNMA